MNEFKSEFICHSFEKVSGLKLLKHAANQFFRVNSKLCYSQGYLVVATTFTNQSMLLASKNAKRM
ncbi:MAG: hypothetical protein PHD88_05450 [Firmicutes bacterium]|nr:hypothetical protein [Bacillota bacterium]MDD4263855.1 hypothetical protein [Bacillota bacterium]MDD4693826.1 hypothetical protein [Bacillota bacterium]